VSPFFDGRRTRMARRSRRRCRPIVVRPRRSTGATTLRHPPRPVAQVAACSDRRGRNGGPFDRPRHRVRRHRGACDDLASRARHEYQRELDTRTVRELSPNRLRSRSRVADTAASRRGLARRQLLRWWGGGTATFPSARDRWGWRSTAPASGSPTAALAVDSPVAPGESLSGSTKRSERARLDNQAWGQFARRGSVAGLELTNVPSSASSGAARWNVGWPCGGEHR
jgi:hypothetical protein